MLTLRALPLFLSTLLLCATGALAAESNVVATDHDRASLVTDADGWAPGRPLGVGLRIALQPGWHTYWSNPGDAGEPATVAVTAKDGQAVLGQTDRIEWPVPKRLPEGPLMSFAYTGDLLLPMHLVPKGSAGGPLVLHATADWLACSNVCVPEHGDFTLTLPAATAPTASAQAPLFAAALANVPQASPFAARIAADGRLTLSGDGLSPGAVAGAWVFPDQPGLIDQVAEQKADVGKGQVTIPLKPDTGFKADQPFHGVVVLRDPSGQERALSVTAQPAGAPAASAVRGAANGAAAHALPVAPVTTSGTTSLPDLLLLALLGGLVLNLMPCVFPVLALKALSLSRLSGLERRAQRLSAVFYTLGILFAFAVLGGVTLGFRAAGHSVGWGFQFQSPAFVAGTCWLLFLVGLNLVGTFEVGGRLAGAGQGLASRGGHAGDFATGLLAVLVATPCAAPFMGVAIAGAVSSPAAIAMPVFLVMGFGLALPYLLFAFIPALVRLMPRPGAWMEILKQALAFPIFAACAWLGWVVSIEGGSFGVLAVLAGLVLLGACAWLYGLSQRLSFQSGGGRQGGARFSGFLALSCLLATLALLPGLRRAVPDAGTPAVDSEGWQGFSEAKLEELRRSGRPVLVDMSAAWCVSCLVNERIAFHTQAVRQAFRDKNVALLKGDWTTHDATITQFLKAHGRDGVPFYIYYPAGGDGRIWPQILTPNLVLHEVRGSGT